MQRRVIGCACLLLIAVPVTSVATGNVIDQPEGPRYIIYYNSNASPLTAVIDTPYTHVILSFITAVVDDRNHLRLILPERLQPFWSDVPRLQAAGKKVMVSFGGGEFHAEDYAPLAGRESELASLLGNFVRTHKLDGIDIDFEASDTFHTVRAPGVINGRKFLAALTRELRHELPVNEFLLSHAPQPPFLSRQWHDGPYLDVLESVGSLVDWIAVQYYGNPGFDNPSQSRVVGSAKSPFHTSYRGLTAVDGALHWPPHKIVVGKPVYRDDAQSGHISPQQIDREIIRPLLQIYGTDFGGLMGWQFSTLTSDHQAWNSIVGETLLSHWHKISGKD